MATYSTADDIDGVQICKQYGLNLLDLEPLDGGADRTCGGSGLTRVATSRLCG